MTIINLIFIQVITVFIIDLSGFTVSMKSGLKHVFTRGRFSSPDYRLKPFDCSLCMVFWTCLVYLTVTGNLTIPYITVTVMLSYLTDVCKDMMMTVHDILISIIRKLNNICGK